MATTHLKGNLETGGSIQAKGGFLDPEGNPLQFVYNLQFDYGYQEELTNATEKEITTGLSEVYCVVATESVEASGESTTPATKILAYKSGTEGNIILKAKGAIGTTKVNWIAIGTKGT